MMLYEKIHLLICIPVHAKLVKLCLYGLAISLHRDPGETGNNFYQTDVIGAQLPQYHPDAKVFSRQWVFL